MSANRFSAFDSDSEELENNDVVALVQHQTVPSFTPSNAQSGGNIVTRTDPITGVSSSFDIDDLGFSDADLEGCLRVIQALGKNPNLFKLPNLKPLRASLHPLIVEQMKNYSSGNNNNNSASSSTGHDSAFKRQRRNKRKGNDADLTSTIQSEQRKKMASLEEDYINQTQLRALRLKQLEKLNDEGYSDNRVPDGAAVCDVTDDSVILKSRQLLLQNDCTNTQRLLLQNGESVSVGGGTIPDSSASSSSSPPPELLNPLSCYICHKPYVTLHFFYHQLCPDCATFNYSKRDELANLSGKVCLVTGGRTKIGFRCVLKLLRCGATVIVTTRFPVDAASKSSCCCCCRCGPAIPSYFFVRFVDKLMCDPSPPLQVGT